MLLLELIECIDIFTADFVLLLGFFTLFRLCRLLLFLFLFLECVFQFLSHLRIQKVIAHADLLIVFNSINGAQFVMKEACSDRHLVVLLLLLSNEKSPLLFHVLVNFCLLFQSIFFIFNFRNFVFLFLRLNKLLGLLVEFTGLELRYKFGGMLSFFWGHYWWLLFDFFNSWGFLFFDVWGKLVHPFGFLALKLLVVFSIIGDLCLLFGLLFSLNLVFYFGLFLDLFFDLLFCLLLGLLIPRRYESISPIQLLLPLDSDSLIPPHLLLEFHKLFMFLLLLLQKDTLHIQVLLHFV